MHVEFILQVTPGQNVTEELNERDIAEIMHKRIRVSS